MRYEPEGWTKRGFSALLLLLVIAIGARVIYGLLAPLLPFLGVIVVLMVMYIVMFRGWRR